jgi:hypothetical protein
MQDIKAYTEYQVAKIVNQSVQTLRNDRALKRGLPYVKWGRTVRYLSTDLEEYLNAHRIETEEK